MPARPPAPRTGDCVAPNTCQTGHCALKPNGLTCTSGSQCISGFCTDGVCCGSAACPTCQACNVTSRQLREHRQRPDRASRRAPPARPAATRAPATAAAGARRPPRLSPAAPRRAPGRPSRPSRAATEPAPALPNDLQLRSLLCGPSSACRTTCTPTPTASPRPASTAPEPAEPACQRSASGVACGSDNQCVTGYCTNGVCCGARLPHLQACNVTNAGVCANVTAGQTAPAGLPRQPALRQHGRLRRRRGLPAGRRPRSPCGTADLRRIDLDGRVALLRHRQLQHPHHLDLRPLRLRDERLPDLLPVEQRLHQLQLLLHRRGGRLPAQEGLRLRLRGGQRVRHRALYRRRLLRRRRLRHLPGLQHRRQSRRVRQRRRRSVVRGLRAQPALRQHRRVRRHGRLPQAATTVACGSPSCTRRRPSRRCRPATAAAAARRPRPPAASPTSAAPQAPAGTVLPVERRLRQQQLLLHRARRQLSPQEGVRRGLRLGQRVRHRLLYRRRLLRRRGLPDLPGVQRRRKPRRSARAFRPGWPTPAAPPTRPAATPAMQRRRWLRAGAVHRPVRRSGVHRLDLHAGRVLLGQRHLRHPRDAELRQLPVRDERVPDDLLRRRRLHDGELLHRRPAEAA